MSNSINKVILLGNLGKDPDIRYTSSGFKIINLSVATSERWNDKSTGELKEKVEWHRVVVFNERLGDFCQNYLKSGSKVYLEGSLQTRKWVDSNGSEKYSTEVVLQRFRGELIILDSKGQNSDSLDNSFKENPPEVRKLPVDEINFKSDKVKKAFPDNNSEVSSDKKTLKKKTSDNFEDEIPF